MKLLLAEDDPMIGASLERGLRAAGFTADWVQDGVAADMALQTGVYDLLLLDLGLPRLDGLSLLKKLRHRDLSLPILIVTARDAVQDRITGLNLGADDYLVKPFSLDELVARVHAILRRHRGPARMEMRLGGLCLNPATREVRLDEALLTLSPREFALLETLLTEPGSVFTREALEESLYGWDEEVASNALEVHLHNLRRKLGAEWIRNVRGVGYKVVEPR